MGKKLIKFLLVIHDGRQSGIIWSATNAVFFLNEIGCIPLLDKKFWGIKNWRLFLFILIVICLWCFLCEYQASDMRLFAYLHSKWGIVLKYSDN